MQPYHKQSKYRISSKRSLGVYFLSIVKIQVKIKKNLTNLDLNPSSEGSKIIRLTKHAI